MNILVMNNDNFVANQPRTVVLYTMNCVKQSQKFAVYVNLTL